MNLHEYQAKDLFRKHGLPVPSGLVISKIDQIPAAINELKETSKANTWVAKVQVHAGGRGKAGGVKVVKDEKELKNFVRQHIGQRLVTYQTNADGQPVNQILVEPCTDIDQELYLGVVIDRTQRRIAVMASTEGGVEIEKVAAETPDKIITLAVDPLIGPQPFQGRYIGKRLGLNAAQSKQMSHIFVSLVQLFIAKDLSLVEVNPLVITNKGDLLCLDAKVGVDGNALYRQKILAEIADKTQEDPKEREAQAWELNYVALDGDIGCMVNGAGLAMSTMDLIQLKGGSPANFLDVGGGATQERVAEAFKIIVSDPKVKAILVNIFGGIVRCDLIADGIIGAIADVGVKVPIVVRLAGNNANLGLQKLADSGLNIIAADGFDQAAEKVVQSVRNK